jgi:hypothetical protein
LDSASLGEVRMEEKGRRAPILRCVGVTLGEYL